VKTCSNIFRKMEFHNSSKPISFVFPDSRSRNMIEKQVFFLDIIGRGEAFSKHRFQAGSRFFNTDT
jgi:hypothetical protein